jgi:hypothetical protein
MCGTANCCGRLTFDFYRDEAFVDAYYDCMTPYLKQKVADNRDKWCSTSCYVKRYENESALPIETTGAVVEEWDKGLCALKPIKEGELVAVFAGEVAEDKHFLRNSVTPNCHVIGREVFANTDIPQETELTLYYHGILL